MTCKLFHRRNRPIKSRLDLLDGSVGEPEGLSHLAEGLSPFQCTINTLGLFGNRRFREDMLDCRRMHGHPPAEIGQNAGIGRRMENRK